MISPSSVQDGAVFLLWRTRTDHCSEHFKILLSCTTWATAISIFAKVVLKIKLFTHSRSLHFRRLFGTKCAKCSSSFTKNDFVMRAKNKIYHVECFRCVACSRKLIPGDEFALRDDGLFCKEDHQIVEKATACAGATQVTQGRQPLRSTSQSGGKLFALLCGRSSYTVIGF